MKVFFVINKLDDAAYVAADDEECDVPYATYEAALRELARRDEVDYAKHLQWEAQREARYRLHFAARTVLEANGFNEDGLNKVLPGSKTFEPRSFESNYAILQLEVME